MSAYAVGITTLTDAEVFGRYLQRVPAIVQEHGGRFVAAGPVAAVLEGDLHPTLMAIMEFDSVEAIHRWYDSDEYRGIRDLRHRAGESNLFLVEDVETS